MENNLVGGPLANHYFAVKECWVTKEDNTQKSTCIMTMKEDETKIIVGLPGYEFLSVPYTGQKPQWSKVMEHQSLYNVCIALNFIFKDNWWKYKATKLSDVTLDMLLDAFEYYAETPKDEDGSDFRSQTTIDRFIADVSDFFANVSLYVPTCKVQPNDLFKTEIVYQKIGNGEGRAKLLPIHKAKSVKKEKCRLMRDIPPAAVQLLIRQAEIHDPMLVFVIVVGITTGLRIGEICQMRQVNSPICTSPGITFSYFGKDIHSIVIDLHTEHAMRAQSSVGVSGIKFDNRPASVYPGFISEFMQGYSYHMELLKKTPFDHNYCPMFVDSRGQAMTSDNMRKRFKRLVSEYFIPALYTSGDVNLVAYAQELQSLSLTPHILRHYFTVRLVLEGLSREAIKDYRRDKRSESAEIYVRNKGAFMNQLQSVHEAAIEDILFIKKDTQ